MKKSICLITLVTVVGLFSVRLSIAWDWQSYYLGRFQPQFITAKSRTAFVVSDDYLSQYPYHFVSVDAVDLSTGSVTHIEATPAGQYPGGLMSAVEFDNGIAVSYLDNTQSPSIFRVRHFSFSGDIKDITPGSPANLGALASEGKTLYVVDGSGAPPAFAGTLLKLGSVGEGWTTVASGAPMVSGSRSRGVVLSDGRIFWNWISFDPSSSTFSWLTPPPGYGTTDILPVTASGDTVYILLKNYMTSSPAVWKFPPDGPPILYDSGGSVGSFQTFSAAFVEGDNLLFGGIFSATDYTSKLLQFNLNTAQFSEFPQQGSWNALYAQICDISRSDSLLVAWEQWGYGSLAVLPSNTPPTVGTITAPIDPVPVGGEVRVSASFTDPDVLDSHAALWTWGDGTSSEGTVSESNGTGSVVGVHSYSSPGVYQIGVTVTDQKAGSGQGIFRYVVLYDPSAGFVVGGGWIDSPPWSYMPNPELTGKATFGFVSKYQKGAKVPTGNTEFNFHAADLNFHSTSYQWLVISGHQAKYKGEGTINGAGSYGFLITAIDGQQIGGGGTDRLRVKIWDKATGMIVYDNQMWADDASDASAVIGGGSITIAQ
jgi:hypothetical protein